MAEPTALEDILPVPAYALSEIPSPFYLYDRAAVRAAYHRLRGALPPSTLLFYSLKANPHPALLAELLAMGARPEVSSSGELSAALAAGWNPDDLLYTGPAKRDLEVSQALILGVRTFSVDSPFAIDQLDALAARQGVTARCLLRVNDEQPVAGQGLVMAGTASQFGADSRWILAQPEQFASRPRATVTGLHFYMGTNIMRPDDLIGQFERSVRTAAQLVTAMSDVGVRIDMLDLGGGFGAPFARLGAACDLSGLRAALTTILSTQWPDWQLGQPRIAFESGRFLVGSAGTLICTVMDVKRSHGMNVIVLDAGINHLGGMSGLRRLRPLVPHVIAACRTESEQADCIVAGPLCTPLDTWAQGVTMPKVQPGDLVAVPNVGAYGLYASLVAFLGHPLPLEVVIDSGNPAEPRQVSRLELVRTDPYEWLAY